MSFHSVAVGLTLVQPKQIKINIHKRNNTKTYYKKYNSQLIQVHITKTPTQLSKHSHNTKPTYTHTQTHITKQVKTTTVQNTHQLK